MTVIVAGTGHRPQKLRIGARNAFEADVHARLVDLSVAALRREAPDLVISGMALGFDTALAEAAVLLDIPFHAYVPFIGQEGKWNSESQAHYQALLAKAAKVVVVSEGPYAAWKLQARNVAMVRDCTKLLALHDGSEGGTGNCVKHALKIGRPIRHLWPAWARYAARAASVPSSKTTTTAPSA